MFIPLGKWSAFIFPDFPKHSLLKFSFNIHIYRLMTHLIPAQNTNFSCLSQSLLEMLLGRASTNELSVLDLFLLS